MVYGHKSGEGDGFEVRDGFSDGFGEGDWLGEGDVMKIMMFLGGLWIFENEMG